MDCVFSKYQHAAWPASSSSSQDGGKVKAQQAYRYNGNLPDANRMTRAQIAAYQSTFGHCQIQRKLSHEYERIRYKGQIAQNFWTCRSAIGWPIRERKWLASGPRPKEIGADKHRAHSSFTTFLPSPRHRIRQT